jgi:transketolase
VWTHDSVGVGEDGPTHQPVEHYAALRAMPNLTFVRPGDPNEASAAWALAVENRQGPTALALTRQKLPVLPGTAELARDGVRAGAYVLAEATTSEGTVTGPELILIATGSELALAMAARDVLEADGVRTRVVSMPCWERFAAQPSAYRDQVLPPGVRARVSIEAGVSLGWERWVGNEAGAIIAIDRFGLSAPAEQIFERFGFTTENVVRVARGVLAGEIHGVISPSGEHGPGTTLQAAEAR